MALVNSLGLLEREANTTLQQSETLKKPEIP